MAEQEFSDEERAAAYEYALRKIAEAIATGETRLDLEQGAHDEKTAALSVIPPEIADLGELTVLDLQGTQVVDLAPLQAMTGLQALYLSDTQVADLAPLQAMTGLRTLWLNNTQVADLAPLQAMTGLQILHLDDTQVADLAPLQAMTGLRELFLHDTRVADLLPLAGLSRLGEKEIDGLWFSDTPAADRDDAHRSLAAIEDDQDRAKQVLQFLNGEHPEFGGPPEPYVARKPPSPPEQQRGGVRFRASEDYLEPLSDGEIGDRAARMQPAVIKALEELIQPLPGSNDFPGPAKWAAEALLLARRDLEDIDAEGWRLWSLSQKFARRQAADDAAKSDESGMAKIMGPEMREALDGVVDALPLFVRQFPECRYYDSETADRRDRATEPAIAEVLGDVARFEIVRPEVAGALLGNIPVEEDGQEADRQAGFNLLSTQNLVYAGLGLVATAAVGTVVTESVGGVMDGLGTRPAIEQRVRGWVTSKPDPIEGILKGAPKDVQASVRAHIERLRAEPAPWEARIPPKKP